MPVESLSGAALVLYGLPISEFVAARNSLEKEVRQSGDRELAARIKALRKPSVVADGLNAVVRAAPDAVEDLLAAVAELRDAHEEIASGGQSDLGSLQLRYRKAVEVLADLAEESRRIETHAALEAAATDPDLHDVLRTGTFAVAPKPTGSFGMPMSIPMSRSTSRSRSSSTASKGRAKKPPKQPPPEPTVTDLRLVRAAKQKAEAAKERKLEAGLALTAAKETLRNLQQRVDELQAELAEVGRQQELAQQAVATAERDVAGAAEAAAKAKAALRQVEHS